MHQPLLATHKERMCLSHREIIHGLLHRHHCHRLHHAACPIRLPDPITGLQRQCIRPAPLGLTHGQPRRGFQFIERMLSRRFNQFAIYRQQDNRWVNVRNRVVKKQNRPAEIFY